VPYIFFLIRLIHPGGYHSRPVTPQSRPPIADLDMGIKNLHNYAMNLV
jgi:hypothetical protein